MLDFLFQDRLRTLQRFILSATLLCLCLVIAGHVNRKRRLGETECGEKASLQIDDHIRYLGQIACGSEHLVPFRVHNIGGRRLVINEVDTECGCGRASGRTILIPPQASVDVHVTLHASHIAGPIERVANFTTNAPSKSRFQLAVRARVEP
jgi:hypothetical protein